MHDSELDPADPRANDAVTKALDKLDELKARIAKLEAEPVKPEYTIEKGER
jgi:hypothetical protein